MTVFRAPITSLNSESRHRVNCGTRVVTELGAAAESAGAPQPRAHFQDLT
jgi:hypothetical protein